MQASDLRTMSFAQIQEHYGELNRAYSRVCEERDAAIRDRTVLRQQTRVLSDINTCAQRIVEQIRVTTMQESRRSWLVSRVSDLTMALKNMVYNILDIAKNGVVSACRSMYHGALAVCNFIYDHFGDIVTYGAVAICAANIAVSVLMMSVTVATGNGVAIAGNPFDQITF